MLEVYIDGSCGPNDPDGIASYGVIVYRTSSGLTLKEEIWSKSAIVSSGEKMSNNVAEYSGLIAFLEWYAEQENMLEEITIYSDSQLLVNQMNGKWQTREGLYLPYLKKAQDIMHFNAKMWSGISFEWIPRGENWEADKLSRDALIAHRAILRRHVKTKEELEDIIMDLAARHELSEDEVKQWQEAEEELEELENANSQ